jgi:hypothetical protein
LSSVTNEPQQRSKITEVQYGFRLHALRRGIIDREATGARFIRTSLDGAI